MMLATRATRADRKGRFRPVQPPQQTCRPLLLVATRTTDRDSDTVFDSVGAKEPRQEPGGRRNTVGVEGTWHNQLGSSMTLEVKGNELHGIYETAVGNAKGKYSLYGARVSDPSSPGEALAFVVAWLNDEAGISQSVTAWSGQWQEVDGEEFIDTTWLLTREADRPEEWESTLVGKDVFTRSGNPPAQIQRLLSQGQRPFPNIPDTA
jgi:hypothetical protein